MKLISEVLQVSLGKKKKKKTSAKITPKEIWPNTPVIQQYLLDRTVYIHFNSGFMLPSSVESQIQHNNIMSVKRVYILLVELSERFSLNASPAI